jgi:arsenate reductase
MVKRIAWSFKDPSAFTGTKVEILQHTREVRDEIEQQIKSFISEASAVSYWIPAPETNPTH